MWIECTNEATERLYVEGVTDEPVEFSDNGKAQVPSNVGEKLINRFVTISESGDSDDEEESRDAVEELDS